jgi:hypothetical protein
LSAFSDTSCASEVYFHATRSRLHGQQFIGVNADEVPALEHLDLDQAAADFDNPAEPVAYHRPISGGMQLNVLANTKTRRHSLRPLLHTVGTGRQFRAQ